jgi:hypothetical protein
MSQQRVEGTVTIEDARIVFRNFAGAEKQYNAKGDRNFAVILDHDVAEQMLKDGWNVKYLKPREDEEVGNPYISVSVSYKGRPPKIVMITSKGRTELPEEFVEMLDYVDIKMVDLIIRPYNWGPIKGEYGVKAYLKTMYMTILEDDLELKYAEDFADGPQELEGPGGRLAISSGYNGEEIIDAEVVD